MYGVFGTLGQGGGEKKRENGLFSLVSVLVLVVVVLQLHRVDHTKTMGPGVSSIIFIVSQCSIYTYIL